ncbi:WD40 repeat-like protein [Sistotremastrum suecicum HHB10207 ss-3]|uniref:WD40 repeat-like protein n=1 Tax=Sistotremastrum suecicum HHB10207 ss-3 TaxID=1314776 RepID=A0A166AIX7_9AGAM|nr:WD40 repeat-like protein [Sistotremastrum suecicum HHB10207 ss-3]
MKWEIIVELKGHHNEVTSARFFDDGKRIISGSSDGTIRIWDATSGEPIGVPCTLHDVGVFRVSLSPNGELVASSSIDGTIWLWNLKDFLAQKSPYPYGSIKHGTSLVNSLAFTVDGQKLLSTSEDHTVRLWDEPKLLFWLPPHYRPTFVWGRCKRLIGAEATELDFSRFKYGDQWTECRTDAVA